MPALVDDNVMCTQVVIKFMPDHGLYRHEKLFYENRLALEGDAATAFLPILFDAFDGSPVIDTSDDDAIPPSLVLEAGNFSLAVCSPKPAPKASGK